MGKQEIDFNDEDAVLAAMAAELELDDLAIDDGGRGFSSFGTDTFYFIETSGGRRSWVVARDDDAMEELALAVIKQDLETQPELFSRHLIESNINIERLRRNLESDTHSSNYDYFNDMSDSKLESELDRSSLDRDDYITTDDEGDDELERDKLVEDLAEAKTERDLEDPVAYLQEILGDEDGIKQAAEIGGFDIDAAAQEAVDTDGAIHFLGSYDGNYTELGELRYWRVD